MARGTDYGTRETRLGTGRTYGAYSGGGVLGTTTSNMSSRRTSSRRRVLTCQKRRERDKEGRGGELRFGRRHDGWSCASIDGASWGEGKDKWKGREQHLLAQRTGDLHHGAARNCALPRLGRRWRFKCPWEAPTPRRGDLSAWDCFTCRIGWRGFAFGLRHACLLVAGVRNSGQTWPGRANEQAGRASLRVEHREASADEGVLVFSGLWWVRWELVYSEAGSSRIWGSI